MKEEKETLSYTEYPGHVLKNNHIYIPKDPSNGDYQDFLKWLTVRGNKPLIPPSPDPVSLERESIQKRLIELDAIISRPVEDIYTQLNLVPFNQSVIDEKIALRSRLKEL